MAQTQRSTRTRKFTNAPSPPTPNTPSQSSSPKGAVIVLSELEKRLKPREREELLRQFAQIKDTPFTIGIHHPILQKYYALVQTFMDCKPQTLITPLLSAMACNVGNKAFAYAFGNKIFCNCWTIIMGPSSITRKSTSITLTLGPLYDADEDYEALYQADKTLYDKDQDRPEPVEHCVLLPESSSEQFMKILSDNPNGLIVHYEIASFMKKMKKNYMGDFKADITTWFDSPPRIKRSTRTYQFTLKLPCFSITTASTKKWLLDELSAKDFEGGFMQRFLICNAQDIERERINCRIIPGKEATRHAQNYLARLYNGLRLLGSSESPLELTFSQAALDLHEKINSGVLDQIFREYNDILFSYWSRTLTGYFIRLCILFCLAEHVERCHDEHRNIEDFTDADLIVSEQTTAYVLKLCGFFFQNIRAFLQNETTGTLNAHERKIINIFYDHRKEAGPEKTLTRSYLKKFSHIRTTKEFDEALRNLIDLEALKMRSVKTESSKRPITVYTLSL